MLTPATQSITIIARYRLAMDHVATFLATDLVTPHDDAERLANRCKFLIDQLAAAILLGVIADRAAMMLSADSEPSTACSS